MTMRDEVVAALRNMADRVEAGLVCNDNLEAFVGEQILRVEMPKGTANCHVTYGE